MEVSSESAESRTGPSSFQSHPQHRGIGRAQLPMIRRAATHAPLTAS